MKAFLTAFLIVCGCSVTFAQTQKLRWQTDICEFEGIYDAKKYRAVQLKDTQKLLESEYFPNSVNPTPRSYADINKLNLDALDQEYKMRTAALENLNIVKTPFWENLRRERLRELEQVYQLSRATMQGYRNPVRLRQVKFSGRCAADYADPLIANGDQLLAAWRKVNEASRAQNSSPEHIKSIFDAQYASPDKLKHAQIEVMLYGWWNCVNALIDREYDHPAIEKEFRKLFVRTRAIACDEP